MLNTSRRTSLVNRVAFLAIVLVVIGFWAVLEYRHRVATEITPYFPPDAQENQQCKPVVNLPVFEKPSR